MTDQTQAAAPAAEAATPVEMKSKAVPSVVPAEPKEAPATAAQDVQPVATATESEDDDVEAEHPEDAATSDRDGAPGKPKNKGVGKRINELTKEKHDALRERDYWREQAISAQRGSSTDVPDVPQAQAAEPEGRPRLEDFNFDVGAHAEAVAEWKFRQLEVERDTHAQVNARLTTLREKESAFEAEHPNYRDVVYAPNLPITQGMAEAMLGTDNAPAVAYHLATHLDEAAAIAALSPIQQAIAIGRIDARLSAPPAPAAPSAPLPKKTTNAPPPPKTVSGAGQPTVTVDDPNISSAQRIALWRQQRANR